MNCVRFIVARGRIEHVSRSYMDVLYSQLLAVKMHFFLFLINSYTRQHIPIPQQSIQQFGQIYLYIFGYSGYFFLLVLIHLIIEFVNVCTV